MITEDKLFEILRRPDFIKIYELVRGHRPEGWSSVRDLDDFLHQYNWKSDEYFHEVFLRKL